MTERIHSDFETIERESQEYRLSTSVRYRVDTSDYKCKATLYKSRNGSILDARRDQLHKRTEVVSSKASIEKKLEQCVDSCRQKMNEIEDAKSVSVEVEIDTAD